MKLHKLSAAASTAAALVTLAFAPLSHAEPGADPAPPCLAEGTCALLTPDTDIAVSAAGAHIERAAGAPCPCGHRAIGAVCLRRPGSEECCCPGAGPVTDLPVSPG